MLATVVRTRISNQFTMSHKMKYQLAMLVVAVALVGCGGGNSLPTPSKVSGVVLYQSKPVAGVVVTFHPDKAPSPSSGTTNEAGEYQLMTYAPGDGAFPGHHKVTVAAKPASAPTASSIEGADYQQAMEALVTAKPKAEEKPLIPMKYAGLATTDLEFDVKDNFQNRIDIELKD